MKRDEYREIQVGHLAPEKRVFIKCMRQPQPIVYGDIHFPEVISNLPNYRKIQKAVFGKVDRGLQTQTGIQAFRNPVIDRRRKSKGKPRVIGLCRYNRIGPFLPFIKHIYILVKLRIQPKIHIEKEMTAPLRLDADTIAKGGISLVFHLPVHRPSVEKIAQAIPIVRVPGEADASANQQSRRDLALGTSRPSHHAQKQ